MTVIGQLFGYFIIGAAITAALTLIYLPFGLILRKRIPFSRQLVYFLLAACVFIVSAATFSELMLSRLLSGQKVFVDYHSINLVPFTFLTESWEMGLKHQISQSVGNVLMFTPLGLLLPIAVKKARSFSKTALCMLAFSLFIEFMQYFIGRTSDIDDVLLNTVGGMLGYALYAALSHMLAKTRLWNALCGIDACEKSDK